MPGRTQLYLGKESADVAGILRHTLSDTHHTLETKAVNMELCAVEFDLLMKSYI